MATTKASEIAHRLHADDTFRERIYEATRRDWPLDASHHPHYNTVDSVTGQVKPAWKMSAAFYISYWGDEHQGPVVAISILPEPGRSLDRLPAAMIRKVAAMKQIYEDWLAGKIPELPVECPPEILAIT